MQALGLGLALDQARARHHQHALDAGGLRAALGHRGGLAQVLDARVGARTDEDLVDRDVGDRGVGREAHVLERALDALAAHRVGDGGGIGHAAVDRGDHLGRGAPGDLRQDVLGLQLDDLVELGALVAVQAAPVVDRLLPLLALGREGAVLQVFDGGLVHADHPRARARLDRHVADRHAAFHRQRTDGAAAELHRVAGAAGSADPADDGEHDVLGGDAAAELTVDPDQHGLRLLLQQALGGEHVLDLGGADAVRQTAEGTVRGGVRIAADNGHAGQRGAVLRTDDMHDALARILEREVGQRADLADVGVERLDLLARHRILDAQVPVVGRRVVVGGGDDGADAPRLAPGELEPLEGLRAGHFMHQVPIDVDQRRAVGLLVDDVTGPELFVQRLSLHPGWFRV